MNKSLIFHRVFSDIRYFLSFGFGSGLSPWMPGTMGTLIAIPLYLALAHLKIETYICFCIISFFLGIIFTHEVSVELNQKDYKGIVWDEVVGFLVTMIFVTNSWLHILFGFILFRFFDILKPFPICKLESLSHDGLSIMLDDVLAGFVAGSCLYIMQLTLGI